MARRFTVALGCAIAIKLAGCGGVTDARNPGGAAGGAGMNATGGSAAGAPANAGGAAGGIAGGRASGGAGPGSGGVIGAGASGGTGGKLAAGGRAGAAGATGAAGTRDAGADGAPDVGVPSGDGGCEDYAVLYSVSWGPDGGLVRYVEQSSLSTPRQYEHERDYGGNALPQACMTEVMGCPSPLLAKINAGLRTLATQQTFGAHTVFGTDSRPVDGQVFRIRAGSGYFDVGTPCASNGTTCIQIPTAVQALVDDLRALDAQELAKKACADVFATP